MISWHCDSSRRQDLPPNSINTVPTAMSCTLAMSKPCTSSLSRVALSTAASNSSGYVSLYAPLNLAIGVRSVVINCADPVSSKRNRGADGKTQNRGNGRETYDDIIGSLREDGLESVARCRHGVCVKRENRRMWGRRRNDRLNFLQSLSVGRTDDAR